MKFEFDQNQLDTMYLAMPGSKSVEYLKFNKRKKRVVMDINNYDLNIENALEAIKKLENKKIKEQGDYYDYFIDSNQVTFYFGVSPKFISYIGKIENDSIVFKLLLTDVNNYPYFDSVKVFKFYPFKE